MRLKFFFILESDKIKLKFYDWLDKLWSPLSLGEYNFYFYNYYLFRSLHLGVFSCLGFVSWWWWWWVVGCRRLWRKGWFGLWASITLSIHGLNLERWV
jgi:hypothetical protein